jgi:hypothetical protein
MHIRSCQLKKGSDLSLNSQLLIDEFDMYSYTNVFCTLNAITKKLNQIDVLNGPQSVHF